MSARITAVVQRYPWLVAEGDGRVCGYAYAHEFRTRQAYRFSVEVSVYVDASLHRAMGFEPAGVYREAGFKFGRWIDVSWWQRSL